MRLSREKTVRLSHRIIDFLVTVDDLDFVEDRDTIRQEIVTILQELLKQEEQVDTEVRAKIASQKKEIPRRQRRMGHSIPPLLFGIAQAHGRCGPR